MIGENSADARSWETDSGRYLKLSAKKWKVQTNINNTKEVTFEIPKGGLPEYTLAADQE